MTMVTKPKTSKKAAIQPLERTTATNDQAP